MSNEFDQHRKFKDTFGTVSGPGSGNQKWSFDEKTELKYFVTQSLSGGGNGYCCFARYSRKGQEEKMWKEWTINLMHICTNSDAGELYNVLRG